VREGNIRGYKPRKCFIIQGFANYLSGFHEDFTMPIYAYRCAACGHQKDVLQKISDAPLTVCSACGQAAFSKQITAAGFQLKGAGWYATDFKSKSGAAAASKTEPADTPAATKPAESSATPAGHACGTGGCGSCA
jgi:putative FmdB family regulatory protein